MKQSSIDKSGLRSSPPLVSNFKAESEIARVFDQGEQIDEAVTEAVKDALSFHKRMGNAISIWSDGQVKLIPPDEIPS